MQVNSLLSAIPSALKKYKAQPVTKLFVSAAKCYKTCEVELNLRDKATKWSWDIAKHVDVNDFMALFRKNYVVCNVPKLRSFMHRAIITNIHLCHWKKKDSNLCSFCSEEPESYLHLFVECDKVVGLWATVKDFLKESGFVNCTVNFSDFNMLFNCIHPTVSHLANFLALLIKQYIYRMRCLNTSPCPIVFRTEIERMRRIEKFIATKNNTLCKFYSKWFPTEKKRGYLQ